MKKEKKKSQEMLEICTQSFCSEAAADFSFFALFLSEVVCLSFLLFFSLLCHLPLTVVLVLLGYHLFQIENRNTLGPLNTTAYWNLDVGQLCDILLPMPHLLKLWFVSNIWNLGKIFSPGNVLDSSWGPWNV